MPNMLVKIEGFRSGSNGVRGPGNILLYFCCTHCSKKNTGIASMQKGKHFLNE